MMRRRFTLSGMSKNTSRFLAINLTEPEYQALRTVAPDPVAWVKTQIHHLLEESGVTPPSQEESDSHIAVGLVD
jgi:hypothetical protein